MAGLRNLCRQYGSMTIQGTKYIWDFANEEPVEASLMTKERLMASEKAKWGQLQQQIEDEEKQG
jgi:hypothetical protein